MSEQKADLSSILSSAPQDAEVAQAYDQYGSEVLEAWEKLLSNMNDSIVAAHITLKALSERVSDLERCITFLLSKDPVLGPKIKESMSKAIARAESEAAPAETAPVQAAEEVKNEQEKM